MCLALTFQVPQQEFAVCTVALGLMLAARRSLPPSAGGAFPAGRRRRFNRINGFQWLLIVAIAVVCARAGMPVLVPPLVAIVVGLHFLPLAVVFEQPRLRVPAALLIAAGVSGLARMAREGPGRDRSLRGGPDRRALPVGYGDLDGHRCGIRCRACREGVRVPRHVVVVLPGGVPHEERPRGQRRRRIRMGPRALAGSTGRPD